jgi:hypothetical protein
MRKPIILIILLFLLSGATLGQDPWKAPKNTYTSADLDKAPPVTYCELTQNSETYRDKIVRVRGIYTWDSEMSYLYDRVCSKDAPPKLPAEGLSSETWVWFDDAYKANSKPEVIASFESLKKQPNIDIIAIGKFYGTREHGGYGHMSYASFGFVIMRLEQAIQAQPKEK